MNNKFIQFLESLNDVNPSLIHTIYEGYILIESLSTDDANGKPNGQTISHTSIASTVNYQNPSTEYFPQTLSSNNNNIAIKSQSGFRIAQFPTSGRTSLGKDALKSNETSNYSTTYNQSSGLHQ